MAEKDFSTSAMIALVPTEADAKRVALDGYQSPDDLHVTLVFLGDADDLDVDSAQAIEAGLRRLAAVTNAFSLKLWATASFNPTTDSACAVYLVGNEEDDERGQLDVFAETVLGLAAREFADLPEQHSPWVPHLTIGYGAEDDALDEVGTEITFDRIRLAIGDRDIDIPLTERSLAAPLTSGLGIGVHRRLSYLETVLAARGVGIIRRAAREFNELLHPRGKDGRFIEKNGWVGGSFKVEGSDGPEVNIPRAKVRGFIDNPVNSSDPIVEVELPDGRTARTEASKISRTAGPKARINGPRAEDRDVDAPDAPEAPTAPDAPEADAPEAADGLLGRDATVEQVREADAANVLSFVNDAVADAPFDDAEARAAHLDEVLGKAFQSALDTDRVHNRRGPAEDQWTPERVALHERMWNDLIEKIESSGIPKDRDALVLGGLPGAGKSTTLKPGNAASALGVTAWDPVEDLPDGPTHVSINPDSIKELLIDYDAMPDGLSDNLRPMEAVTFIHEESSFLSKLFLARLSDEGYNVVLDNTMETPQGMLKRMTPLAAEGYEFRGLFVDIPVEESRLSARRRYARGMRSARGGRLVPSNVQHGKESTRGRMSPNRDAFDELAGINEQGQPTGTGWFKDFMVIDNTGVSAGSPAGVVTVQGQGDGSPAKAIRDAASPAPSTPSAPDGGSESPPFPDRAASLDGIADKYRGRGAQVEMSETGNQITLSKIVAPERGQGLGTEFMNELLEYADGEGKTIALTPSADFGGSRARLIEFYKRFGFVENKGRNRDLEISETMYRPAAEAGAEAVAPA